MKTPSSMSPVKPELRDSRWFRRCDAWLHKALRAAAAGLPQHLLIGILALTLSLHPSTTQAQTINWGSTASTVGAGNKHFTSDGSAMTDGFTFQLGYFDSGYSALDPSSWASSWRVYDDSSSGGIEGQSLFSSPSGIFGYSFSASTTITESAFTGQQGYIFGFNNLGSIGTPAGEAFLVTNNSWLFPSIGDPVLMDWTVDTATQVVWGALDANIALGGGEIVGGGVRSSPASTDSYHVQTASFTAVPEPSSALLLAVAGLALRRRRRHLGH